MRQAWTSSNAPRTPVRKMLSLASRSDPPQDQEQEHCCEGLKLHAVTSLLLDKGTKPMTLNAVYKQSSIHTRAALDVFEVSLSIARSASLTRRGRLASAPLYFNCAESIT